jgi:hypothetical protein
MGAAARAEVLAHHTWTARARSLFGAIDRLRAQQCQPLSLFGESERALP